MALTDAALTVSNRFTASVANTNGQPAPPVKIGEPIAVRYDCLAAL